jgi:hypothetical protein
MRRFYAKFPFQASLTQPEKPRESPSRAGDWALVRKKRWNHVSPHLRELPVRSFMYPD